MRARLRSMTLVLALTALLTSITLAAAPTALADARESHLTEVSIPVSGSCVAHAGIYWSRDTTTHKISVDKVRYHGQTDGLFYYRYITENGAWYDGYGNLQHSWYHQEPDDHGISSGDTFQAIFYWPQDLVHATSAQPVSVVIQGYAQAECTNSADNKFFGDTFLFWA